MMRSLPILAGLAAALSFASVVPAAEGDGVPPALRQCVAERDDMRRLACFDAEMARLAQLPSPPTPEQKFGARGELARDMDRKATPDEPPLERLTATAAQIVTLAGGELRVTLDNGQVWQQLATGERFRLKVGDQVTIKPGVLGSYFLEGPYRRSMKVKRLK